jgi:hypothetical protein
MKKWKIIPGVDKKLLIKDAGNLLPDSSRRLFLRGATSLGALTFLTGCDIVDQDSAEKVLRYVSTFNDRVQAAIFHPQKLAPVYPESMITEPFPFNAYYSEDDAPDVDGDSYRLEVAGLVENKKSWTLPELYALPQERQITRHICVEGRQQALGFPQACRRGSRREVRLFHLQGRLFQHHRHADGAAPANTDGIQVRQRGFAAQIRLPDENSHADQARLQESQARHRHGGDKRRPRRLLGRPWLQLVRR